MTRCWSGAVRREVLDARDDGHRPQHRALNDESVDGLAKQAGSERFAWDSYRRLIQMFGKTVMGVDGEHFDDVFDAAKRPKGVTNDLDLDDQRPAHDRRAVQGRRRRARRPCRSRSNRASSSTSRSARSSIRGTATAPSSTAGRSGSPPTSARRSTSSRWSSATSAWTPAPASRSPATRAAVRRACTATTCRTRRARTSSPGIRNTVPLADLEDIDKPAYDELMSDHVDAGEPLQATSATSSSRSSATSCGCCRPGSASAPRPRRSPSRRSWSTRA